MEKTTTLSPVQRFWLLLKPDQKEIRNVYVYAIFNGLINLSLPIGIQAIINIIQGGQMSTSWVVLVIFVVSGIALSGILQINQLKITENLQQKIFTRAAFEFTFRIPRVKLEALYNQYAPELMNRFFDVMSVQKGLSKILIDFSTASIQVVFGLLLLSLYHPFFIIFSLVLVILVYSIFRFTTKRGLDTSLVESKHKYRVAHWLQELARTSTTFKLAGKTDLPLEETDKLSGRYISARESHFRVLLTQYGLMIVFKLIVATGLLVIGSILVMEQQMNIGQFVAAEIIILLIINSVEKLILSLETIYDVLTSLAKIGQVTDLELETNEGQKLSYSGSVKGLKLEMENVIFSYPNSKRNVIDSLSLTVEQGENLLITGDNDSGKSTLLYLMAGLYTPQSGFIAYNELPLGNLEPAAFRSIIGDCLMDELLFEGSILDNISMGRAKASFENVQWAVRNLGLENFIKSLPDGYNTIINPSGKQFAGGVVDKLLLARAIADKPKLLLIKGSLESIEINERRRIIDFLTADHHQWTMIVASSNNYLAKCADRIAILDKGKIKAIGDYDSIKSQLPN